MELYQYFWQYFKLLTLVDLFDILVVCYLLYRLLKLIKNTTASRLLQGIVLLLVIMQVSNWLQLNVLSFIFRNTLDLGMIALVIMFQPELRKMLDQVGRRGFRLFQEKEFGNAEVMEKAIMQIVEACGAMSWAQVGALIVFERGDRLSDIVETGTTVDAQVTSELLQNIFYPKAPLHDGAVIIRRGRIMAAGCVLPLSENSTLSRDLGTRHRAAVGITERMDALGVVVSEETGSISVSFGGTLKRHLAAETLEKMLRKELLPSADAPKKKGTFKKWMVKSK